MGQEKSVVVAVGRARNLLTTPVRITLKAGKGMLAQTGVLFVADPDGTRMSSGLRLLSERHVNATV